ncbi:hypothetical protein ACJJTC_006442 [Scirpophaga incertulas]
MVPLSESLFRDCVLEAVGEQKKNTQSCYPISYPIKKINSSAASTESEISGSNVETANTNVTTVALVHSSKPSPGYQDLPINLSVKPLKLNENRIHIISSEVIVPARGSGKTVLKKAITSTEDIEVINSNIIPSSSLPTKIVCSPLALTNTTSIPSMSVMPNTPQSNVSDTSKEEPPKKKKRPRDPTSMTQIQRAKHPILAPCQCAKECSGKITQLEREEIWRQFWNMDRQRRRDFISRQVERVPTMRTKRKSRRTNTLKWSLNKIAVCKIFFLHTLGFNNDEVVQSVMKSNYLIGNKHPHISAAPDSRGRRKTYCVFRIISKEYGKVHTQIQTRFFSLQYKSCTPTESICRFGPTYRKERNSRRDLQAAEAICDLSKGKKVLFTVDMQKAICMPIIDIKAIFDVKFSGKITIYFSRKLVLFNESFVPPGLIR